MVVDYYVDDFVFVVGFENGFVVFVGGKLGFDDDFFDFVGWERFE